MVTRNVRLLIGPPGGGKSHEAGSEMIERPGLCLFALPGIPLLKEQQEKLLERAPGLHVVAAHSSRAGRKRVQLQVDEHLDTISEMGIDHAVLLVTHEFLQGGDLTGLDGWRFYIDEPPSAVKAGRLSISKTSLALWRAQFDLEPVKSFGRLVRRSLEVSNHARERGDTLLKDVVELRRAVESKSTVIVDANSWRTGQMHWMTLWTPLELPNPQEVVIGGAGYLRSLGYRVAQWLDGQALNFVEQPVGRTRSAQPKVTISYFSDHERSSKHWPSWDGLRDLQVIADHIRSAAPDLGYWSANEDAKLVMSHRIATAEPVAAKLAGLNRLDHHESCAFIYSSKAVSHLQFVLDLCGLTHKEARISAEDEDIFQFVYRGAIRRPDYGGPYRIFLFSRQQAERLSRLLSDSGLENVTLEKVGCVSLSTRSEASETDEGEAGGEET